MYSDVCAPVLVMKEWICMAVATEAEQTAAPLAPSHLTPPPSLNLPTANFVRETVFG